MFVVHCLLSPQLPVGVRLFQQSRSDQVQLSQVVCSHLFYPITHPSIMSHLFQKVFPAFDWASTVGTSSHVSCLNKALFFCFQRVTCQSPDLRLMKAWLHFGSRKERPCSHVGVLRLWWWLRFDLEAGDAPRQEGRVEVGDPEYAVG